jgi:flagellar export protein FliJ
MKAFRFRLQAVLTLREQVEQAAEQRCARSYAAVEGAAARVRSAEAEIDAAEQAHRAQLAAGPRASQLEQLRLYAGLLHERRRQLARELAEARRRADEARRQLLLATQQREALERLRGRQQRAHDYQSTRAEQQILDELVGRGPSLSTTWKTSTAI